MVSVTWLSGRMGIVVAGGTGPAERDVVLPLEAGLVVYGEPKLVGEHAGEVGCRLVVRPVACGTTESDDSGVAVVATSETLTETSVLGGAGGGLCCISGFLEFGTVFRDREVIAFQGLFGEVSGKTEAVFQQILQHDLELIRRGSGVDPGHHVERGCPE